MVKQSTLAKITDLIARYPQLAVCQDDLVSAVKIICDSYRNKHKLIVCGNGGSAADSEHIVGELMKGFLLPRRLDEAMAAKLRAVCPAEADYFRKSARSTAGVIISKSSGVKYGVC